MSRARRTALVVLVLATCAGLATVVVLHVNSGPAKMPSAGATTTPSASSSPSAAPTGKETVVGLGDSVMAGNACDCSGPAVAYAALMSTSLHRQIEAVNLGVGGATTSSLQAQLGTGSVRTAVAGARVVLVIIGANDLLPQLSKFRSSACDYSCYHPAITSMSQRLNGVLDEIADIRGGSRGTVLVSDYWNVFRDGSGERQENGQAEITWGRTVSRDANQAICQVSEDNGAVCVDTYTPFFAHDADPDRYLAADGDHPNKAGVQLIAEQLQKATPAAAF